VHFPAQLPDRLEDELADWLPRQRWFAGKDREINKIAIASDTILVRGDPGLHHVLVAVHQEGSVDRYQLLLGTRRQVAGRLGHAVIFHREGLNVYDAVHDPELTREVLALMADNARRGALSFHTTPGVDLDTDLISLASPAEQSNTSLIYGESYICKIFRRVAPEINPDLELNLALTRVGCQHIPQLYGWIDDDGGATLAILSEYLATATDGWRLATASVRDFLHTIRDQGPGEDQEDVTAAEAGGDFAAEAERLGAAAAAVHHDLAVAFGVGRASVEEIRLAAAAMHRQLAEAIRVVPALRDFAAELGAAFDGLAGLDAPVAVQRIHGDFHLGQVLRSSSGWAVLDFEGEPARPVAERRAMAHPLRDVAGMLRSFEYAARYLLPTETALDSAVDQGFLEARARDWADRNRAAFCQGYAQAGGPDPAAHQVLLRAFEYDKAVYEVLYEARNRPGWLHVPLSSLNRLRD
jgi:maltokinase